MRKTQRQPLRTAAALMGALALVIAACGGGESAETTAPVAPAAPSDAVDGGSAGEPLRGGTLNIAFQRDVQVLDGSVRTVEPTPPRHAIFEGLYATDVLNTPQPALATSADVSSDGLTWTFQLRPGVKFHNGQDFTSADVVASYERFRNVGTLRTLFIRNGDPQFVATGPLTVEARLNAPFGSFLEIVAQVSGSLIMLPAEIATANVENDALTTQELIGTGPYKLEEFIPDTRTVLVPHDDYVKHEGEPSYLAGARETYFDRIVITTIADDGARVAALLSGEVDVIFPLPADDAERVNSNSDMDLKVLSPGARVYVKFNPRIAPFSDPLVREAVRTALNPEEMMIGFGDPALINIDHTPRYQEGQGLWIDQSHLYPNDLEAGKALLERSSYDGETIILLAGADRADFPLSISLQQLLQRLGMKVEMRVVDGPTFGAVRRDTTAWNIKGSGGGSLLGVARAFDASGQDRTGEPWPGIPDSWYAGIDTIKNTSTIEDRLAAASVLYDIHGEMNYEMWMGSVYLMAGYKSDLVVPSMDTLPFWQIYRVG